MKILELFCGSKSISNVFEKYGHKTLTLDFDNQFNPDLCVDILDFDISMVKDFKPDVVWASIECRCFSVASMGHHWMGGKRSYIPKTEDARISLKVVQKTIDIINELNPMCFFIENPVGVLKNLDNIKELSIKNYPHTVTYCQYGDKRMKPTFILTNNKYWNSKPPCHNGNSCHESAPRGSKTGTQGLKDSIERSKIPYELCLEIMKACETMKLHDNNETINNRMYGLKVSKIKSIQNTYQI